MSVFEELTPSFRTYELRGQGGKKSSIRIKDKQTPHTVLQKLSPKTTPPPLNQHLLTPRRQGLISHTYLWGGGFQRYHKSFKIGHKPFYSQVNDKEWLFVITISMRRYARNCRPHRWSDCSFGHLFLLKW